jgi:phage gp16-like protein
MKHSTPHTAAIHVLKAQLKLSDADYRALLNALTAKSSCKDMTDAQRQQVRDHMQRLAERAGLAAPSRGGDRSGSDWQAKRAAAGPRERKVWAIWNALKRAGVIDNNSEQALNAWVKRTVQVDALRFCTVPQQETLIEALKRWQARSVKREVKHGTS